MTAREGSAPARWALAGVVALHAVLLLVTLPDYRVSIDSGYHVSLARLYAEQGTVFWDPINYGPEGRPNLQGPALHVAIAVLGSLLGGRGDDYVLANALLAVLQWGAALFTAGFFARRAAGDWGALFAVALLSGSAFAALSFAVGIPSGWLFILTPWAIHLFLKDRWLAAAGVLSVSIYVHLGGYATAPVGVVAAAVLTRRWRALLLTGITSIVLTAPYTVHVLRSLDWYVGVRGHVATLRSPLIELTALAGCVLVLRRPRRHLFLIAWLLAPAAWLVQDPARFLMQATITGAVLGGVALAAARERWLAPRWRPAFAAAVVVLATLFPLSVPSVVAEATWAVGLRFPRMLDWDEARALAAVIERESLGDRLVQVYNDSFGPALAVYTPVSLEGGHWIEVRPRPDPSALVSAGAKTYVMPLPPQDPLLRTLVDGGLARVHGGTARSAVMTLTTPGELGEVAALVAPVVERNARWLAAHAVNNRIEPIGDLLSRERLAERRARLHVQRLHAGRIAVAALVYAYALEPVDPERARGVRDAAHGYASLAAFLSDEWAADFMSDARHERLRENLRALAPAAASLSDTVLPSPELDTATDRLFAEYF